MKFTFVLHIFTSFSLLIYANTDFQNVCYVGNLKFGNETCLSNLVKDIPKDVVEGERLCEEIACMPYLKKFQAHICFQQKANEIKFIIFDKDMKKDEKDILLFEENESYMLKQVAISGTMPSNLHITLRLVSGILAYRLAFNCGDLGVKNANIPLQTLGPNNLVIWQSYVDYDRYFVINHEDKSVEDSFIEFHNNTSAEKSPTFGDRRSSKSISNEEMCFEWSAPIPDKKTTVSPLTAPTAISISEGSNVTTIFLIIAGVFFVVILCCGIAILIPLFCCLYQKSKTSTSDENGVRREANVAVVTAPLLKSVESPPPQLLIDPFLPHPPPLPPQLPQSLLTPPPSYRTDENVQVFSHFLAFMQYLNNFGTRNNNNNNSNSRPCNIVEMEALTRPSQNDLAFE